MMMMMIMMRVGLIRFNTSLVTLDIFIESHNILQNRLLTGLFNWKDGELRYRILKVNWLYRCLQHMVPGPC